MRPWLSVIMPTYHGERFLDEALASIAAEHDGEIEVVAVDDGSTDLTLDILRRWSRSLELTIIERRHSGDWVSSTAIGMAAARGQYLSWLHQDDTWRKGRLAALRRRLAAHPGAAFVVHPCWYSDPHGRRIGYWRCPLPDGKRLLSYRDVAGPLLVQCSIAACGTIFSADAARAVGPPDAALAYHADWDYWLRLARLGRTLYHPTPLASFRIHAGSQTISRSGEADDRLAEAQTVLRRHLPDYAECSRDAGRIAAVAAVSADLNHALNSLVAGRPVDLSRLMRSAASLGPTGGARLLRDSRIVERCLSRLQASAGLRAGVLAGMMKVVRRRFTWRGAASSGCETGSEPGELVVRNADGGACFDVARSIPPSLPGW